MVTDLISREILKDSPSCKYKPGDQETDSCDLETCLRVMAQKERKFYLLPGKIYVSREATLVTTILGSCVSICLWDPTTGIGGINHFLLPGSRGSVGPEGKYADLATKMLVHELSRQGAFKNSLTAKVFGGSHIGGSGGNSNLNRDDQRETHLGAQNIKAAMKLLKEENIPVVMDDVNGSRGRKLLFCTGAGQAWMKYI